MDETPQNRNRRTSWPRASRLPQTAKTLTQASPQYYSYRNHTIVLLSHVMYYASYRYRAKLPPLPAE